MLCLIPDTGVEQLPTGESKETMKRLDHRLYLVAGIAFLGLSSHAIASPLGMADISNCPPGGGVTISATTFTWLPSAGPNVGCIAAGPPTSLSYSGGTFTSGTGTIRDLSGSSTNPFMVLAGGVLDFSLTGFGAVSPTDGVCSTTVALALGHSCVTSAGSPILLVSEGALTALSWTTLGVVTDTGNSSTSPYKGLFSQQLTSNTAAIASTIDAGGSITDTYSAAILVGIPEPASFALLSVGLVLFGIGRKRFGKR